MRKSCDCCGFETECKEIEAGSPARKARLCKICRETPIADSFFYPTNHTENRPILRTLGWCFNELLREIKKNK